MANRGSPSRASGPSSTSYAPVSVTHACELTQSARPVVTRLSNQPSPPANSRPVWANRPVRPPSGDPSPDNRPPYGDELWTRKIACKTDLDASLRGRPPKKKAAQPPALFGDAEPK